MLAKVQSSYQSCLLMSPSDAVHCVGHFWLETVLSTAYFSNGLLELKQTIITHFPSSNLYSDFPPETSARRSASFPLPFLHMSCVVSPEATWGGKIQFLPLCFFFFFCHYQMWKSKWNAEGLSMSVCNFGNIWFWVQCCTIDEMSRCDCPQRTASQIYQIVLWQRVRLIGPKWSVWVHQVPALYFPFCDPRQTIFSSFQILKCIIVRLENFS